jgi:hypothetical protein
VELLRVSEALESWAGEHVVQLGKRLAAEHRGDSAFDHRIDDGARRPRGLIKPEILQFHACARFDGIARGLARAWFGPGRGAV